MLSGSGYHAMPPRKNTGPVFAARLQGPSPMPLVSPQPPSVCHSNNDVFQHNMNEHELNMHVKNTITSQWLMIRNCVRTQLFRRLKFFKKDIHEMYDTCKGSVFAPIIQNCDASQQATLFWWSNMRKHVICTHTDHRNNVIKTIWLHFVDGVNGKIQHHKINSVTTADMAYMLGMREHLVHYVNFIDIYAPCIVHKTWINVANTTRRFCTGNGDMFQYHILLLSNGAFLLLVMMNYAATWMSEIHIENAKVQAHLNGTFYDANMIPLVMPKYTLSRKQRYATSGEAGIRWSDKGIQKFNELYDLVEEGRGVARGEQFYCELLNVELERRSVDKVVPAR